MILRWEDDGTGNEVIVADREMVAAAYGVSEASVRRHVPVYRYDPAGPGSPRGAGKALYLILDAADQLAGVQPRAGRLAMQVRQRMERRHLM